MKNFTRTLIISSFALLTSVSALAEDDAVKIRSIAEAAGLISLEQAQEKALASKPGTVIEAELDDRTWPNKGWDYEFEIIDADGKEWDVDVDGKTGEVSKVKADWF